MVMTAEQGRTYRNTTTGRASAMYHTSKKGAVSRGLEFDLPLEWYKEKLKGGFCEVTGLPFVLNTEESPLTVRVKNQNRHPFAPSVDRTDSAQGYSPDNCKMVVLIYNTAKGSFTDDAVEMFCRAYLNNV